MIPRLWRFVLTMFRPHIYVTYGILWTLTLEGSAVLLSGTAPVWTPSWHTAARATTVVLVLLFMRMLDEQKDLDYDRVHNPDRPLVTGAITATELRIAMTLIAIAVTTLNALLSTTSVLLVLADLAYGLSLAVLERQSPRTRDALIPNLLITYPVQLILSAYLYFSLSTTGTITPDPRAIPLLLLFACVFLHFEFARKTAWHPTPGTRLYSNLLGPIPSAILTLALAAATAPLTLLLFHPWSTSGPAAIAAWTPYLPLACPTIAAWQFLTHRTPTWPLPPAILFVLTMFLSLLLQATVR